MEEIWKDVAEYEGIYQVSNFGRVRSLDRKTSKGWNYKGKMIKLLDNEFGYLRVKLSKDGVIRNFLVHRLVAQAFLLLQLGKNEVNHIDGNKKNNHVSNLEWTNRSENILHTFSSGHYKKKLTVEDVKYIKKHYKKNDKNNNTLALAQKFGVSRQQISNIVAGRSHKNV